MPCALLVSPMAERGGSDQALLRLVRSLSSAGVEVHVVVPAPTPLLEDYTAAGAGVHVAPMRRVTTTGGAGWFLRYALEWPVSVVRLVRLVRRLDADLVATNSLHSWYGWAAALATRRPHVWHAREIVVQSRAALTLERWLVGRFTDLLVACSHAVSAQFADVLSAERVVVVHEDVDRDAFSPARAGTFRVSRGLADDAPLVGFVGRIDTWKGVDVLLRAWGAVRTASPQAKLVIVGGAVAGKESYAEQLLHEAASTPGVHWVGPVDEPAAVMADLDVLVAPSTSPEPYGLVLVEALASGARVVSTAAGGPPEIAAMAEPGAVELVRAGDPEPLAAAVLSQLRSSGPTSVELRRSRHVALPAFPTDWAEVYAPFLSRSASATR